MRLPWKLRGRLHLGLNNQLIFTYLGYTFTIAEFVGVTRTDLACDTIVENQCRDKLSFDGRGVVSSPGFDDTEFLISWTAQGTCTQAADESVACGSSVNASWSASISATGRSGNLVPEPHGAALLGAALLALFAIRRRVR